MLAELTFRDPVHGFVRADSLEADLVASRPMQRLRFIRQLGLAPLVFPGAEHSRFSHALGVMHLAGRLYDALATRSSGALDPSPRCTDRRTLRAAALLHDVGHAPFSHTAEELFDEPIDHEEMSRRLLHGPEIRSSFARHDLELEPVIELLAGGGAGSSRLLAQALSGELDVDKMDYLLRDSLFCGVEYGRFDLERLLDTVLPIEDPETGEWGIGVDAGGVHALEALVLARYYMFTQVYFNVTVKVLELHLNQWLTESGVRWSADPERFMEQDDVWVHSRLRTSRSPHARALLERERYQLAAQTREHLSPKEAARFEQALVPLKTRFGDQLLISRSSKDSHRLRRSRLLVRHEDGSLEPMAEASRFIRHLDRIEQFRVYSARAIRDEVSRALADDPATKAGG
ncbi:MAG TPA: HD domain-containing protein [Thermoanaerobaculia bacterium]|nr:HD domain-containing protein [Thermoanaerobaculia bacterium]